MRAISYEQITSLSSATGLNIPANASMVWLQAETSNIRYKLEGGTPTAASGMIMRSTEPPIEIQTALAPMKFIQEAAGAILNVTYFG